MKKKAMFYCQHVLGMGHLIRSAEIVRALVAGGYEVCFLNGGELAEGFTLPDGIKVINLPPIKADAEFRAIHSADGSQNLEAVKAERKKLILETYERQRPDVLVVELFPFGRRKFAFELVPLLEQIQADGRATKVVCSLRGFNNWQPINRKSTSNGSRQSSNHNWSSQTFRSAWRVTTPA